MERFIVTGTDTGVGKTVFAAALTLHLNATYWKPVQTGEESDSEALIGLGVKKILPEIHKLKAPLSPHRAAELEGVKIFTLPLPDISPLVIEGAGGLMVPLSRNRLYIDQFQDWGLPIILVARTSLGTINHTLLSVEALKKRGMKLHGIAFIGDDNPDNIRTIADFAETKVIGRIPWMKRIDQAALKAIPLAL